MFAVTGASGHLGRLVIDALLSRTDPRNILALARDPAKLADLAERGVTVRAFDYSVPDSLAAALGDVDRLLLISSSEVGQRETQHRAVIDAAKAAGVGFIAYTSILHADANPLDLAVEHRGTETALQESGISYALLRNGWYNENYTIGLDGVVEHGVLIGSVGEARVAAASRKDYAEAAAIILAQEPPETNTYELAGDSGFTQAELAAAIAAASGKPVVYQDLPEADYAAALEGFGIPGPLAHILADSSAKAGKGALFDDSGTLGRLIGRPTTPIAVSVQEALQG
ncbi:SDR family oxidoreductase [Sphingobium sp. H39-3-25]|uniref:SDR family oxidoreductase n=1 Tax=Sphingomonadales TaxID=204457 RepID=UPI0008350D6D|nr:SDR family oxidoreductase [Novosphingobium naphthalenivorans]MDF0545210.1 SDR family oxidoreductase [Sphingobium arseniciresistens]